MTETTDRIPCPHCQASNFPTSTTCWQCGRALRAEAQPPGGQPPPPGQPPPYYPQSPPPAEDTKTLVILGFVFAGLSLLCFCCPLFGIVGIIMGIIVQRKGNPIGMWIIIASAVTTIIGLAVYIGYGILFAKYPEMWTPGAQPKFPFPMPPSR